MSEEKRRIKNIELIKITVIADGVKDEFVSEKPSAVIISTIELGKGGPVKGGIQMVGKMVDVLYAYYLLTKQLIGVFGDKKVVKVLRFLFKQRFNETTKDTEFVRRALLQPKDEDIN